jgi:ribosomal protein S4
VYFSTQNILRFERNKNEKREKKKEKREKRKEKRKKRKEKRKHRNEKREKGDTKTNTEKNLASFYTNVYVKFFNFFISS